MKSRTTTKKTAATKTTTKTTTPAPRCTCEAVPFKPTEAQRAPLAPLVGPIGPLPLPARSKGGDHDRDIEAERVALRSTKGEGDRYSLIDMLTVGLTGDDSAETPLDVAIGALEDLGAELRVLSTALGAYSCDLWPYQMTADRTARRAEMVADLVGRMERARTPKPPAVVAPEPHEMAGALLTLPGVLDGAPDAWERLSRICERLDVEVVTDGPMVDQAPLSSSSFLCWPREPNGPSLPAIIVKRGDDKLTTVARMLGCAVARREGYSVSKEWRHELAACLVPPAVKEVA